ncbi:MAG: DUF1015 domain-containing protein [Planctomycetaceae bacterium]
MADVEPFRGWRYDLGQVGDLADVTAPPYDVIDPAGQKALYEKHPCNVVRLILNRDEPGDDSPEAKYERAASFLKQWEHDGILVREREDSLYVYHQEFDWEGTHYVRKGFLGRIRLEEFGKGRVYPHEQTMSGPKADRLLLLKACRTNLSPIFGLYPDSDNAVQEPLERAIVGKTPLEVVDEHGVKHRLWPVDDRAALNAVRDLMKSKPIFIADGHHRYETACTYRNWLIEQGHALDDAHPANFTLMMFVGMADPGLAILPTHRLVTGMPGLTADGVRAALGEKFELELIGSGPDAAREAWELMEADGGQEVFGFGTAVDGKWLFARVADASDMSRLAPQHSADWRRLGVSLLHRLVLDHLFAAAHPGADIQCRYVHLTEEVNESLAEQTCDLACLVQPAGIEQVERIASQFEKMPPKSTFFHPKLLSGLVFHPVHEGRTL